MMNITLLLILLALCIEFCFGLSYNKPKFDPAATWNPNGTTIETWANVSSTPLTLFVDNNDTIYVGDYRNSSIRVWPNGNVTAERTFSNSSLNRVKALFVTENGNIYAYNLYHLNIPDSGRVLQWSSDGTTNVNVMNVTDTCYGLFIDLNNTLYCSIYNDHIVLKRSLVTNGASTTIAAGNGTSGSTPTTLYKPEGIFVDANFSLYVADSFNDRIQCFLVGQTTGTTVVVNGSSGIISLNSPSSVVLDSGNYLFIVDSGNNRIIGSGPNGFRCIVGCSGSNGSSTNEFNSPRTMSFDSYGNIYVTDVNNGRIQKFLLCNGSCDNSDPITTQLTTLTTTTTTMLMKETTRLDPTTTESTTLTTTISTMIMSETSEVFLNIDVTSPVSTEQAAEQIVSSSIIPNDITSTKIMSSTDKVPLKTSQSVYSSLFTTVHQATNTGKTTKLMSTNASISFDFYTAACNNSNEIGSSCNISGTYCDLIQPCKNNATCIYNRTINTGYYCQCPVGFNGSKCEMNIRPCQTNTCWNNGTCLNISISEFVCLCTTGWTGRQCQTKINYCENVTCKNNGVCRPLLLNYQCECSSNGYSGRYCEITSSALVMRKIISKSTSYIAIICILLVIGLFVILDVLKYIFHMDVTRHESQKIERQRKKEQMKKKKKKKKTNAVPTVTRFVYVNRPPPVFVIETAD